MKLDDLKEQKVYSYLDLDDKELIDIYEIISLDDSYLDRGTTPARWVRKATIEVLFSMHHPKHRGTICDVIIEEYMLERMREL